MNTLRLEIPEKYAISFGKNDDEVRRNASEMLAVGMYRQGKLVSRGSNQVHRSDL